MQIVALVVLGFWIICAVFAYGLYYGIAQNNWLEIADETRATDRVVATFLCVYGPAAILAILLVTLVGGRRIVLQWRTK